MSIVSVFDREATDRARKLSIELANSYREMQNLYAWKDMDQYLTKIVDDSNREVDQVAIDTLNVETVARARGLREAVDKIRKHIGYRTSEGPK